jgi:hypothetical protein
LPVGIVFKGSGFYSTDHRSPSGASRTSSAEKSDEKSDEPKKESDKKESDKKESESTTVAPSQSKEKTDT